MDLDLDDFGSKTLAVSDYSLSDSSPQSALDYIDRQWYADRTRRARLMDLIGDYAGTEPFALDGEALFQQVLNDPLLAIGHEQESSYQILHAKSSLEYMLEQLLSRSAVFDIVFFTEQRHLTLKTGSSPFVVASRTLARRQLFLHLANIDVSVYVFSSIHDAKWTEYENIRKPMFIMTNDGGSCTDDSEEIEAILCQRAFLFDVMSRAIPVVPLRVAEFRDSKIMTFVYEQGLVPNARSMLSKKFWTIYSNCQDVLNNKEERMCRGQSKMALSFSTTKTVFSIEKIYDTLRLVDECHIQCEILWAFLAHCLLLPQLSVKDRAQKHQPNHQNLEKVLLDSFLPRVFITLEEFLCTWAMDIDIDCNVFGLLLRDLLSHPEIPLKKVVGSEICSVLAVFFTTLNFSRLAFTYPPSVSVVAKNSTESKFHLLPFKHDIFDEHLSLINVPVGVDPSDSSSNMESAQDTVFDDRYHWHNPNRLILPKHLGGEDFKPKDPWSRRRQLKRYQKFTSRLNHTAETLTGALGSRFNRITIPSVSKSTLEKTKNTASVSKINNSKKGKGAILTSKQKLLQDIERDRILQEDKANSSWWQERLQEISRLDSGARLDCIQHLHRNPRTEKGWLSLEVRLCRLHHILSEWIARDVDRDTDHVRDEYTVKIVRIVKGLYESKYLTPTVQGKLASVLVALGMEDSIRPTFPLADDRKLSFEFIKLIRSKSKKPLYKFMRIIEDLIQWQLRLFGDFLDRSMDSKPDPRVAFEPDAWQREVLDCLDKKESVLVVAPTSAGKTFISFYAMEQVLRECDDGVLVYIAPTKALVSQITAEVYARFSKDPKNGTCWAVHTRDYQINDPQKCQILVTVPEILSIMMLSPETARTWLPRIKRIIMDEIHTIGQQDIGEVWEQILLLAPCPIIGLSATIGEPEVFNKWLESVQNSHGFKHTFIHHPHRYSHLRKFYYLLPQGDTTKRKHEVFEGLERYTSTNKMTFLHPISILCFGARSMPQDLSLEARDTLSLYNALKTIPGMSDAEIQHLEPTRFFKSNRLLRQQDILLYESALKTVVTRFISDPAQSDSLKLLTSTLSEPAMRGLTGAELNTLPRFDTFESNLITLVADLHSQGDLPALIFHFDRSGCEFIAYELLNRLEEGELHWRRNSQEWVKKIRAYHAWQSKAKQRERQLERALKQKPDDATFHDSSESSWEASFDPDDPSPQFSFAGTTTYSKAELEKEIQVLAQWKSVTDWRALRALRRGIGIHHSGMNKAYRALVESLFRQGYLRVVIATGTFALGINAPTKTSVFCGDSPYLTALMYRQCAGRAGRRGYDLLGKVVFYGLTFDRVQRLVLSRLPSLRGNFPLTSTLVLRMFNLVEGSCSSPAAVNAVKSLITLPQLVWGSSAGGNQSLHHLRFSIDYLRRSRLLDCQGKPLNLFGIAAHLYYTEPSNFALVALIRGGVLHKICDNRDTVAAKREFILLMSHLFGRRYLPRRHTSEEMKEITHRSTSKVVLPRLNSEARKVLLEHEETILRTFELYASNYATHNWEKLGEDDELPLSKISFRGSPSNGSLFHDHLRSSSIKVVARSPFVANSGHTDLFGSVPELARTTRYGVHLNEYAIPSMSRIIADPDEAGMGRYLELNAYLFDFWTHGQTEALVRDNGIRKGDIWYLLQDFLLCLMTIRGAIAQLLSKSSSSHAFTDTQISEEYTEESDIDSGYGASDLAERDEEEVEGEVDEDNEAYKPGLARMPGISDRDWRVYEVVNEALTEFEEKFKTTWV